jgi:uncharacterized protein YbjT (DUF2867 family)
LSPAFVQPVVSDDVAAALADFAVGPPVNGTVELAGPERFSLDELVRRFLDAKHDARQVVPDIHARYFGAELLDDRSLTRATIRHRPDAPRGVAQPVLGAVTGLG